MLVPPAPSGLRGMLAAFLVGDPAARAAFPAVARPIIERLARYHGRFLREHLLEDVVQEAFHILLRRGTRSYNPARTPAERHLRFVVRDAVKRVDATSAQPGRRTRPSQVEIEQSHDRVDSIEAMADAGVDVVDERAEAQLEARCDVALLLRKAKPVVQVALTRIHLEGRPQGETAEWLGMTRHELAREIDEFIADCVSAA